MFPITVLLSVAATVTPMIGDIMLFGALFGLAIIMFVAALARQTIITTLLSCVLWFALSFAVWNFGEATSALTQGGSVAFMGLGTVMLLATFKSTYDALMEAAAEKQRRIAEEVM